MILHCSGAKKQFLREAVVYDFGVSICIKRRASWPGRLFIMLGAITAKEKSEETALKGELSRPSPSIVLESTAKNMLRRA